MRGPGRGGGGPLAPAMPVDLRFSGHPLRKAERYSLARDGAGLPLSDHFTLAEFASRDGADAVHVHPALVALLEIVRAHFGAPVRVNSGYRSPEHNRDIGGAALSRHTFGLAADIVVDGILPQTVHAFLVTLAPGGLGKYRTFTHVDVQGVGRRWAG